MIFGGNRVLIYSFWFCKFHFSRFLRNAFYTSLRINGMDFLLGDMLKKHPYPVDTRRCDLGTSASELVRSHIWLYFWRFVTQIM